MAHVDVYIDRPLLPLAETPASRVPLFQQFRESLLEPSLALLQSFATSCQALAGNNVARAAATTFIVALLATFFVNRFLLKRKGVKTPDNVVKQWNGRWQRVQERFKPKQVGVPMPFDDSDNEGWGVCTLRSKKRFGQTSFDQYEFDLPRPEYVLPLELGQTVSMCCLDNENSVAKGDFFPFEPTPGSFSILAPTTATGNSAAMDLAVSNDAANFVRVLKQDLKVGDEVALKPGQPRLSYQGQHLPVTDMVYVACGVGIVPVLEQVRAVLPDGSSSVASVIVLWINESSKDFDGLSESLEKEYFKYKNQLSVSCVVVDRMEGLAKNPEVHAVVPKFKPGTMAVLSGPRDAMRKASSYLQDDLGYPDDTICVL